MGEGGVRVMTMVALDIAFKSVKGTDEVGSVEVMRKISELARLVDNTLDNKR